MPTAGASSLGVLSFIIGILIAKSVYEGDVHAYKAEASSKLRKAFAKTRWGVRGLRVQYPSCILGSEDAAQPVNAQLWATRSAARCGLQAGCSSWPDATSLPGLAQFQY